MSYPCHITDAKGLGAPHLQEELLMFFSSQPMGSTFTLHGVRAGVNRNLVCTLYQYDYV